MLSIKSWSLS